MASARRWAALPRRLAKRILGRRQRTRAEAARERPTAPSPSSASSSPSCARRAEGEGGQRRRLVARTRTNLGGQQRLNRRQRQIYHGGDGQRLVMLRARRLLALCRRCRRVIGRGLVGWKQREGDRVRRMSGRWEVGRQVCCMYGCVYVDAASSTDGELHNSTWEYLQVPTRMRESIPRCTPASSLQSLRDGSQAPSA